MENKERGYPEPLIMIALAIGVLGLAWHQTGAADSAPAVAAEEVLKEPAEGPGHGNYCRIPERGVYFYGRDFDAKSGTYERFADWCSRYGGAIGWVE